MRLTRLVARGFRNLAPFDLSTDHPFVVFCGPNAQGKTNALEAVYLLCTLRPLRGSRRRELIGWEGSEAAVAGWVRGPAGTRHHRVDLDRAGLVASLDGKRVSDLVEYFGPIRCIAFTPQDGRIVTGQPGGRRRWLDRAAFTARPAHLHVVRAYRRALAQKAAALRAERPDPAVLDALDAQVARAGAELVARREAMLAELAPHVEAVHRQLSGQEAQVALHYRTAATGGTAAERAEALAEALARARPAELRRGLTLVGPQTDEIRLQLDGRSVRTYGSRGQVRSLVLALKLAELIAARDRGQTPLFLLDDMSGELDRDRTARLVGLLAELRAQVWVTTTGVDHLGGLPLDQTLVIEVDRGKLRAPGP